MTTAARANSCHMHRYMQGGNPARPAQQVGIVERGEVAAADGLNGEQGDDGHDDEGD